MSASGTIRCGAPADNGTCQRRLHPGERCGDHRVKAPLDGSEPGPLEAKPCRCARPIRWSDDLGVHCLKCGHDPDRRPKASKPPTEVPPAPAPALFPGEQLELEL